MKKIFKSRKPGPTDLTWDEKNPFYYLFKKRDKKEAFKCLKF